MSFDIGDFAISEVTVFFWLPSGAFDNICRPMSKKRFFLVVLDSCGVGEMPDAAEYGDLTSNTLGNISRAIGGLNLPEMEKLGLGNIIDIMGVKRIGPEAKGAFGKAASSSKGKDTTVGHLELAGIILSEAFPTYPKGFPKDLLDQFCAVTGAKGVLGNKTASGTEIIKELGDEHVRTGLPIVYTSADSVFQIAAHESIIIPENLWKMCDETRSILKPPHNISRVIARPFMGEPGNYTRTSNRRDFTLDPPGKTVLDHLKESGHNVYGIGKIEDIFNGHGLTKAVHTKSNLDGIQQTIAAIKNEEEGLTFVNLVDFDMKFGHRNDEKGYAGALKEFDCYLPEMIENLRDDDILILTADHGCDPTYKVHTDHTREYVPILVCGPKVKGGVDLGVRKTFADIGQTIADFFAVPALKNGTSFLSQILKA